MYHPLSFVPHTFRQDFEVNECLKQLVMSLLRAYRFSPIIPDLGFQVSGYMPRLKTHSLKVFHQWTLGFELELL